MRPRFVLLTEPVGDTAPRERPLIPSGMMLHAVSRGLTVLLGEQDPILNLEDIGGWLVGRLFRRSDHRLITALDHEAQAAIAASRGRHLIENFWGSYVAIWLAPDGRPMILRDPSATMPVFILGDGSNRTAASDIDLLIETSAFRPRVDWTSLAHHLRYPLLRSASTCLMELKELLPGECRSLVGAIDSEILWHPASFLRASTDKSASRETCEALAGVIDAVVAAWSGCFSPTLLELSGGLDSSILAAALARTGSSWSGVTIAMDNLEGDERRYARLVAERFNTHLDERMLNADALEPLVPMRRMTAYPTGVRTLQGLDALFHQAALSCSAKASFSGTGGDNIFCYLRSTAPILDAFRAGGLRVASWAFANLVEFSGASAWEVATSMVRRLWRERRGATYWITNDIYLMPGAAADCRGHPWLETTHSMRSGQRSHIKALLSVHPILAGHDRATTHTMIFPLLSQPVMEACLAIPSWQWTAQGRDREPARRAFAARLPSSILARRHKGHLESVIGAAFKRDLVRMRDLLVGGRLVQAGLVDGRAVAEAFTARAGPNVENRTRLTDLVDAELWVRSIETLVMMPPRRH